MAARDENADTSRTGEGQKGRAAHMSDVPATLDGPWSVMDDKSLGGLSATRGAADIEPSERHTRGY